MIPKTIHYCWFGGKPLPKLAKKCIESWKKICPDYQIIQWDESNFDLNCCEYVKCAYAEKKYAFVSDYARLKILYDNGGIYLDTDVELLKRFPDEILENGYLAKETDYFIATGLGFACKRKNIFLKGLIDKYNTAVFEKIYKDCGDYNYKTCVEFTTEYLKENDIVVDENTKEVFDIPVYPKEYFCGFDVNNNCYDITEKTISVHHYSASWTSTKVRFVTQSKRLISHILGKSVYSKIRYIKNKLRKQ